MHRVRNFFVALGGAAVFAFPSPAPATDADPPLPLMVKQRLIELTAAPTPARGPCVNTEAMRALVGASPGYAEEIALFAARRLHERVPRAGDDCSCLTDLAKAVGGAVPDRSASLFRLVADQAPACGGLVNPGIDAPPGGGGGMPTGSRTASGGGPAGDACAGPRTCATPLLRPVTGLIGPTRVGGDS